MKKVIVEVDANSGFCFGVIRAINKAEEELSKYPLFCLGEIVHNEHEVARLHSLGLKTIQYEELNNIQNNRILFRAHGEPPQTYNLCSKNNNQIIDATCPVVLQLQKNIRETYNHIVQEKLNAQIIILGKVGHAEVIGLQGQTQNTAIVIQDLNDLNKIDFNKKIHLFAQTTASLKLFNEMVEQISKKVNDDQMFEWRNTICKNVINRSTQLRTFVQNKDLIIFVGGRNSSNAKYLFAECCQFNPQSYFYTEIDEMSLQAIKQKVEDENSVEVQIGICGATSTPLWVMQDAKIKIENLFK